jgi:hypothetical protein
MSKSSGNSIQAELEKRRFAMAQKYSRFVLLLPTYKMVPTVTYQSMLAFVSNLYKYGFNLGLLMVDHTNVVAARNKLAENAYLIHTHEKADIFAWIDSDHTWTMEDFFTLLRHFDQNPDMKVLSARNLTRERHPRCCGWDKYGEQDYISMSPALKGIQQVDAIGFGFCLMDPEVITRMYEVHGVEQFMLDFNRGEAKGIVSEDIFWCKKAEQLGYKFYVDCDVVPGHYGAVVDRAFLGDYSGNNNATITKV